MGHPCSVIIEVRPAEDAKEIFLSAVGNPSSPSADSNSICWSLGDAWQLGGKWRGKAVCPSYGRPWQPIGACRFGCGEVGSRRDAWEHINVCRNRRRGRLG